MKTGIFAALFCLVSLQAAVAQEWAQRRGPKRDGVATAISAPASWPKTLTLKWRTAVGGGYSSPVLDGDYLYGLSHLRKGQFFYLDARTGEVRWATDGREGANAAVVSAGEYLVFLTDGADLIVAARNAKGFEAVARYDTADSTTWAHPVLWGKQIIVKDESSLALWGVE